MRQAIYFLYIVIESMESFATIVCNEIELTLLEGQELPLGLG
jgi:hypothetical protein